MYFQSWNYSQCSILHSCSATFNDLLSHLFRPKHVIEKVFRSFYFRKYTNATR